MDLCAMNVQVYVVPAGIWVMNRDTGESSPTTASKCYIVSEQDGKSQYPIDGKKLCKLFTNRDGTSISPRDLQMGRRYPIRRRHEMATA